MAWTGHGTRRVQGMGRRAATGIGGLVAWVGVGRSVAACQQGSPPRQARHSSTIAASPAGQATASEVRLDEMGTDAHGIPRYTRRRFTVAERALLRSAYGVDEPNRMYVSDSSDAALVKFDTKVKRCRTCYVDSYRVGFLSLRTPGETWDALEARLRRRAMSSFSPAARVIQRSLGALDPESQAAFAKLIDAGRQAGFRLTIIETYRTPEREALLFAEGRGRTYTATSMHSYGRAVDIAVDDGNPRGSRTRHDWIRFRRFVLAQTWGRFHLIGAPDKTWDWPHVELASPSLGFRSIDDALRFAAQCTSDSARGLPSASVQVGGAAADPCVFVPALRERRY